MSKPFDISITGTRKLRNAINDYVHEVRRDKPEGYMEAVRLAAAFIAQSLSKNTKIAKPNHPKFRKATEGDIKAIGLAHGMTGMEMMRAWYGIRGYTKEEKQRLKDGGTTTRVPGAYVGIRGFNNSRGLPYHPMMWISCAPDMNKNGAVAFGTTKYLNKRWAYVYTGLARASWLTMKQQSQRIPKMGQFKDKIAAVLPRVAVVWVRPETLSIHFWNRLSYADKATPDSVVKDAVKAGTNRLIGYTNDRVKKAIEKHLAK